MGSYRVDKVASIVRDVVGEAMTNQLHDPRISPLASVTRVEVSGDLQMARVYISVIGEPATGRTTLAGLTHAAGHIQRLLARQLTIRRCPALRFVLDESLKKAAETMRIIEHNARTAPPLAANLPPVADRAAAPPAAADRAAEEEPPLEEPAE
ncbi:MAG: 30S ribosome-binding factor RbfA [Planctomycetes bacterium]|nr:30S ribosome-binding factor RbfA [Planctomycetota bacterium]